MALNPFGVTITPQRFTETGFSEGTWADLPPIEGAVFALSTPTPGLAAGTFGQAGSLFVPRGSDLQNGDRVTHQGVTYAVVGNAQWDQEHPLTGQDEFGYVQYDLDLGLMETQLRG